MTDLNWRREDYFVSIPDVPAYKGPLAEMPFLHQVGKIHHYVMDEIIPEIMRALSAKAELAGLVLSLALVDYIAGYYVGEETHGKDYIDFMNHYFPEPYETYTPSIYRDLRNGLMHNLAAINPWRPEVSFFIHDKLPHLTETEAGKIFFSIPVFVEDIRRAWIMYMHDLVMKEAAYPSLRLNFVRRFGQVGGLGAYMERIPD